MKKINFGIIGDVRHFKKNIRPEIQKIDDIKILGVYRRENDRDFFNFLK